MVSSISSAGSNTASTTQTAASTATGTNSDYLTFLRMLTTQVQNQDPLNPMESTDFAAQLATFSGVEQQVQTNNLLSELLDNSYTDQLGQYSDWIGRDVRTTGAVWFDGDEPISLQFVPQNDADAVNLIVLDSYGKEISREGVPIGSSDLNWQGLSQDGSALAPGLYQFRLESSKDGELLATSEVASYSEVTGVELSLQGPVLVLRGDSAILVSDVTGLRG